LRITIASHLRLLSFRGEKKIMQLANRRVPLSMVFDTAKRWDQNTNSTEYTPIPTNYKQLCKCYWLQHLGTVQNLLEGDFMGKWYPLRNKWRHYLQPHYAHNGLMVSIPITDPVCTPPAYLLFKLLCILQDSRHNHGMVPMN